MHLFNLCRVPPGACGCRPKRPKPRDQGPVQRRGRVTARPVFARSFFLAESDPAVLLSCQIFLHAQQIALAGTLNNPQQLSHEATSSKHAIAKRFHIDCHMFCILLGQDPNAVSDSALECFGRGNNLLWPTGASSVIIRSMPLATSLASPRVV